MKARVLVKSPTISGVFEINRERCIIGRHQADLTIQDPFASHNHAMLFVAAGGTLWIRDLRSKNGLYLNGKKVNLAEVVVGDRILIGNTRIVLVKDHIPSMPEKREKLSCEPTLSNPSPATMS